MEMVQRYSENKELNINNGRFNFFR